jgi:hypothetical protein
LGKVIYAHSNKNISRKIYFFNINAYKKIFSANKEAGFPPFSAQIRGSFFPAAVHFETRKHKMNREKNEAFTKFLKMLS